MARKKVRIGELLVGNGVITEAQLDGALAEQKKTGLKLGRQLIQSGAVDEDRFLSFLSEQLDIPCIQLAHYHLRSEVVQLLPETHARRFRAIILEAKDDSVLVGMADPTNIFALDEIEQVVGKTANPAVVRESELIAAIDQNYRRTEEIKNIAEELRDELGDSGFDLTQLEARVEESDAPVVRLLKSIFEDAVQMNASDIHIEPDESCLRIRLRIDGVLHEQVMKEIRVASALVLRLKLMTGLDISEKRLPQDGRFNIRVKEKSIDVRLSTMPVQFGESVVMRLLDQSAEMLDLEHVGMPRIHLDRFRRHMNHPHGLILVTGPTGSGKTTTLYAALSELNLPTKKIITVEDPVEYHLPRINQVGINEKIGLSFARVLRAALRQDPDIVLVGEMRDQETVEIGLRAAMTGHLVFSTLHTNDAPSTAARLLDMGGDGVLVATALRCVLAQRLVRRVCDRCTSVDELDDRAWMWIRARVGAQADQVSFVKGEGCTSCNGSGYRGRVGIYELLEVDLAMADALRRADTAAYNTAARAAKGYRPLSLSALEYAARGITSMEEVFRVAGEVEDEDMHRPAEAEAGAST